MDSPHPAVYEQSSINYALQKEILLMCEIDQILRMQYFESGDEKIKDEYKRIDQLHYVRLQEIINQYGWPGYKLVGENGSFSFWLLVQHTDDVLFQKKCLELLKLAVLHNDAKAENIAYLTDRILVNEGKSQVYGTQLMDEEGIPYPIEDEEHVNERRKEMDMSTLEEYLEWIPRK